MDGLTRFDIAEFRGTLMVVVESDLLPPDPTVVIIPLLPDYPAVARLNPVIEVEGRNLVLATRLIAAVRRAPLAKVGTAKGAGDAITRALDVLISGV